VGKKQIVGTGGGGTGGLWVVITGADRRRQQARHRWTAGVDGRIVLYLFVCVFALGKFVDKLLDSIG
jgi:hypothetical protein